MDWEFHIAREGVRNGDDSIKPVVSDAIDGSSYFKCKCAVDAEAGVAEYLTNPENVRCDMRVVAGRIRDHRDDAECDGHELWSCDVGGVRPRTIDISQCAGGYRS